MRLVPPLATYRMYYIGIRTVEQTRNRDVDAVWKPLALGDACRLFVWSVCWLVYAGQDTYRNMETSNKKDKLRFTGKQEIRESLY